ncbi:hypothetical protein N7471_004387 [Penicillium samsonianum]|uniref:uncharacterized protein n=1 Tax=Penicillium samsonianum TaxID=1882272 RepID=UPI0025497E90|nr:uncharacterized protein N7471_004387 [Penicillium samsonianum]KAJ6137901.1 hypothetical protein N7471_004387 [Penicillium samsonianum]
MRHDYEAQEKVKYITSPVWGAIFLDLTFLYYLDIVSDPDDAEKERAREHRRRTPVGLVGVGCATHCLDEVRRGLGWAEQISPETCTQDLDKGVRNALLYESHGILIYVLAEENAPVNRITPQYLFFMDSLPL